MNTQMIFTFIFASLIIAQIYCAIKASKSDKPIAKRTRNFNLAIILPIFANIIIINSQLEILSIIGYYLSYVGMSIILIFMVRFTEEYCKGVDPSRKHSKPYAMYILGAIDILQMTIMLFAGNLLGTEKIILNGQIFYADTPMMGLTIHRVVNYTVYASILLIYIISVKKISKLYREKYTVILITLIVAGVAQGIFIASRTPIDKSILIHGTMGIVVYYFSIRFRPLRLFDTLLSGVASNMNDAVYVFDSSSTCVFANDAGYQLLNTRCKVAELKDAITEKFGDLSNKGDNWSEDVYLPDTKEYFIIEKKSVISEGLLEGFFIIIRNNTERHNAIEREMYESTHDKLTGLFNMSYLYRHVKDTLKTGNITYCAIYINIKNFKIINDIFGNKFGDRVLRQFASWLKETFKDEAVYGRLIGDTFGIFMPYNKFDEKVFTEGLADFIVRHKNKEHQICFHIGVYEIKDRNLDPSVMFDRAHMALSTITDNYKTSVKVYDETLRQTILEEQRLSLNLAKAIEDNEIKPYLQPIMNKEGEVVGAEALARWEHPELGFLPPYKFIPAFEKTGLIVEVDKHIWEESCKILHRWKAQCQNLFISINVSPKDFYFIDVVQTIKDLVDNYKINPRSLRIEITETAMMADSEEKIRIFDQLRQEGFIVEMDDFGSGYSSLNLLKKMPVDILKIDMNFLENDGEYVDKAKTIVKNVISLSNELQMTALTEGVETEAQFNGLKEMGCSLFQGYYFSKPMPVEEFEEFIKKRKTI